MDTAVRGSNATPASKLLINSKYSWTTTTKNENNISMKKLNNISEFTHFHHLSLWPISTKQMGKVLFSNPNVRFCTQELWETHRDIIPEIYSGFQPSNYYFCTVVEFFIKYEIGSVPCVHCSFDNQIIFPSNFYYTSVHRSINIFTVINLKYFTILYHL